MKSQVKKVILLNLAVLSLISLSLIIYYMKVIFLIPQQPPLLTSIERPIINSKNVFESSSHILNHKGKPVNVFDNVRKISQEVRAGHVYDPCIVMVGQLNMKEGQDINDLLTTIQMNLWNPFVCEYHFLQKDNQYNLDLMSLSHAKQKVKIKIIGTELTIGKFMEYSNENTSFRLVLLTCGHVFFDHTLVHVSTIRQDSILSISMRHDFGKDDALEGFIFKTTVAFSQSLIDHLLEIPLRVDSSHLAIQQLFRAYKLDSKSINVWNLITESSLLH